MNDQINTESIADVETVAINKTDFDFAVKCLNAAHEYLKSQYSAERDHQARTEICWALVGLGQDIPQ
jgi:hypothetical protein